MNDTNRSSRAGQYLTFFLNGEEYAIGVLKVREIIEYHSVTRVPGTPAHVAGVINLRGSVVPVFDLSTKFGLAPSPVTKLTCIVVLEASFADRESAVLGIVADSVHQVVDLGDQAIEPPPRFGTNVRVDYLIGIARTGDGFVLVLDIDRLVSGDEVSTVAVSANDRRAVAPEAAGALS